MISILKFAHSFGVSKCETISQNAKSGIILRCNNGNWVLLMDFESFDRRNDFLLMSLCLYSSFQSIICLGFFNIDFDTS